MPPPLPPPLPLLPHDEPEFEFVIQIAQKPKSGTKKSKTEPLQIGPVIIPFGLSWDGFLSAAAGALKVPVPNLKVGSFKWWHMKPKNSPHLPLVNEDGFASMIKKLRAKAEPCIFLSMDKPVESASLVRIIGQCLSRAYVSF